MLTSRTYIRDEVIVLLYFSFEIRGIFRKIATREQFSKIELILPYFSYAVFYSAANNFDED